MDSVSFGLENTRVPCPPVTCNSVRPRTRAEPQSCFRHGLSVPPGLPRPRPPPQLRPPPDTAARRPAAGQGHGWQPLRGGPAHHHPRGVVQEPSVSNIVPVIISVILSASCYPCRGTGHASQEEINEWVKKELEGNWQSKG